MTSLGKYRHLMQSSTSDGHFIILAIDHRANLREALEKASGTPISDAQFADFKGQVIRSLSEYASALLVDPAFGFARAIVQDWISPCHGLLAPLEVTDYDVHPSKRELQFIEGWSVEQLKKAGGTGVKLLLNYHPEAHNAAEKQELVEKIVADCARFDIPFFLEPILYSLDPQTALAVEEKSQLVVESVRVLSRLGVDVMKVEFPCDLDQQSEAATKEILHQLNDVCVTPWAILSGGVSFETFLRQTKLACQAGASGVIVGRAIWSEAVTLPESQRDAFLTSTACDRMKQLVDTCAQHAHNWRSRVAQPITNFEWYQPTKMD